MTSIITLPKYPPTLFWSKYEFELYKRRFKKKNVYWESLALWESLGRVLLLQEQLGNQLALCYLASRCLRFWTQRIFNALFWKFWPEVFSWHIAIDSLSLAPLLRELKRVIWANGGTGWVGRWLGEEGWSQQAPWGVGTGRRKQTLTHVEKEPSEFGFWSGVEGSEAKTPNYLDWCVF